MVSCPHGKVAVVSKGGQRQGCREEKPGPCLRLQQSGLMACLLTVVDSKKSLAVALPRSGEEKTLQDTATLAVFPREHGKERVGLEEGQRYFCPQPRP